MVFCLYFCLRSPKIKCAVVHFWQIIWMQLLADDGKKFEPVLLIIMGHFLACEIHSP